MEGPMFHFSMIQNQFLFTLLPITQFHGHTTIRIGNIEPYPILFENNKLTA